MKKKTVTPRIRKKVITGRELLMAIRQAVLDEPLRANLGWWISALDGKRDQDDYDTEATTLPACGTVACLAGWGAVLLRPDHVSARKLSSNAEDVLTALLAYGRDDFNYEAVGGLFNGTPMLDETHATFGRPGTRQHARTIAKRITRYLKDHPQVAKRRIVVKDAQRALKTGRTKAISFV